MSSKKNIKFTVLIVALSLIAVAAVFFTLLKQSGDNYENSFFYSMDTYIETGGSMDARRVVRNIFDEYESVFDFHNSDSELSQLNSRKNMTVSPRLSEAVRQAVSLSDKYGGDADITVGELTRLWDIEGNDPKIPSDAEIKKALATVGSKNVVINGNKVTLLGGASIDMGCCAKGAALDSIKTELENRSEGRTIVSAGGSSILLYGDDSFTTGIQSPDNEGIIGKFKTGSGFVSTSGGYHRFAEIDGKKYVHILDTKTGKPSETDLTSVTVFCDSGIESDLMSTLIFAGGTKKIQDYLNMSDMQVIAIDENNKVYKSDGVELELTDGNYTYAESN